MEYHEKYAKHGKIRAKTSQRHHLQEIDDKRSHLYKHHLHQNSNTTILATETHDSIHVINCSNQGKASNNNNNNNNNNFVFSY